MSSSDRDLRVQRDWGRLVADLSPYRGRDISVVLRGKKVPLPPDDPAKDDGHFTHFYLALPPRIAQVGYVRSGPSDEDPEVVRQLRHQTGLRLRSLSRQFNVYFTSGLLEFTYDRVTPELCGLLIDPNLPQELSVVHDVWIRRLLGDERALERMLQR